MSRGTDHLVLRQSPGTPGDVQEEMEPVDDNVLPRQLSISEKFATLYHCVNGFSNKSRGAGVFGGEANAAAVAAARGQGFFCRLIGC
jgi:hypothetical protein